MINKNYRSNIIKNLRFYFATRTDYMLMKITYKI